MDVTTNQTATINTTRYNGNHNQMTDKPNKGIFPDNETSSLASTSKYLSDSELVSAIQQTKTTALYPPSTKLSHYNRYLTIKVRTDYKQ